MQTPVSLLLHPLGFVENLLFCEQTPSVTRYVITILVCRWSSATSTLG